MFMQGRILLYFFLFFSCSSAKKFLILHRLMTEGHLEACELMFGCIDIQADDSNDNKNK